MVSSSFYGWKNWGTERTASMSQVTTKLGFISRPVQHQSCCSSHSRMVQIFFFLFCLVSVQKYHVNNDIGLWKPYTSDCCVLVWTCSWIIAWFWANLFISQGLSLLAYEIGDWTAILRLFLCHGSCESFGSEHPNHRQGLWKEMVQLVTGGLWGVVENKLHPGTMYDGCWHRAL